MGGLFCTPAPRPYGRRRTRIARVNPGMNRDRAACPVPDRDVARTSQHFEVDRAVDLERPVKVSNLRSEPASEVTK